MHASNRRFVRCLGRAAAALTLIPALAAQTLRDDAMHVLHRTGFGPTPALVAQLTASPTAIGAYLANQLAPPSPLTIPPELTQLLADVNITTTQGGTFNSVQLIQRTYAHALLSEWQLVEVMTWFWNNHFNRSVGKIRFFAPWAAEGESYASWFLKEDDDYYRANALGMFRDLLRHTARSPAMLAYLDNHYSVAGAINENWGRELLELFTMGQVNASAGTVNYTQADVVGAAKCFTGWHVAEIAAGPPKLFATGFADALHDTSAKLLFRNLAHPLLVPANGTAMADGDMLLDHLAGLPATADFVCRKLMVMFFGDDAPAQHPALLQAAKAVWGTQGAITQVLGVLLQSPEFMAVQHRWSKVKNPMRHDTSLLRTMGLLPHATPPSGPLEADRLFVTVFATELMGQSLFGYPSPDGYPDGNTKQIGVSGFLDRVDTGERILPYVAGYPQLAGEVDDFWPGPLPLSWDVNMVVEELVKATPSPLDETAVADFLIATWYGDKPLSPADRAAVLAELGTLPATFDPQVDPVAALDYIAQVRRTCELLCSFTHFSLY